MEISHSDAIDSASGSPLWALFDEGFFLHLGTFMWFTAATLSRIAYSLAIPCGNSSGSSSRGQQQLIPRRLPLGFKGARPEQSLKCSGATTAKLTLAQTHKRNAFLCSVFPPFNLRYPRDCKSTTTGHGQPYSLLRYVAVQYRPSLEI